MSTGRALLLIMLLGMLALYVAMLPLSRSTPCTITVGNALVLAGCRP